VCSHVAPFQETSGPSHPSDPLVAGRPPATVASAEQTDAEEDLGDHVGPPGPATAALGPGREVILQDHVLVVVDHPDVEGGAQVVALVESVGDVVAVGGPRCEPLVERPREQHDRLAELEAYNRIRERRDRGRQAERVGPAAVGHGRVSACIRERDREHERARAGGDVEDPAAGDVVEERQGGGDGGRGRHGPSRSHGRRHGRGLQLVMCQPAAEHVDDAAFGEGPQVAAQVGRRARTRSPSVSLAMRIPTNQPR
jgi:hypothetical protein